MEAEAEAYLMSRFKQFFIADNQGGQLAKLFLSTFSRYKSCFLEKRFCLMDIGGVRVIKEVIV
jgi:hypothetical protein